MCSIDKKYISLYGIKATSLTSGKCEF